MYKEFLNYKLALVLKELGFDELCFAFYATKKLVLGLDPMNGDSNSKLNKYDASFVSAPLKQQAFSWLYQKLDIEKGIMPLDTESQQILLRELIERVKDANNEK